MIYRHTLLFLTMPKTAFLINCNIPKWEKMMNQIERTFQDIPHQIFLSEYAGHLPLLAIEAIQQGYNNLIVAGGDGSINELVNGVIDSQTIENTTDWDNLLKITLGIIPFGTGNDFVKSLQQNLSLSQLKSSILHHQRKNVDIGIAEFQNKENQTSQRYFINITDVGMGGIVAVELDKGLKFLPKSIRYKYHIAKTFLTYKKSEVKITAENYEYQGKVMNVIFANGKFFGNGLGIAPEAELEDGLVDLVILGDVSIIDYLSNLAQVTQCKKLNHPQVFYHKTKEIKVESSNNEDLPIDMDGEFIGYAPLKIINLSKRIYFYC